MGNTRNRDANGYKKVIIAPHFSVGDTNVLSFSTFDKNMYFYIYLAKKYKDSISFVLSHIRISGMDWLSMDI